MFKHNHFKMTFRIVYFYWNDCV